MNLSEATAIVESLANGIDPVSGQPLPELGPYHHPGVILVCRLVAQLGLRSCFLHRQPRAALHLPWAIIRSPRCGCIAAPKVRLDDGPGQRPGYRSIRKYHAAPTGRSDGDEFAIGRHA